MSKPSHSGPAKRDVWYMQIEGSEFGPLTTTEVQVILNKGKLTGKLYAWKPGMTQWQPIEEVQELTKLAGQVAKISESSDRGRDKRKARRLPLLATVEYQVRGGPIQRGICRDISLTGMQIHSNCKGLAVGMPILVAVFPVNINLMSQFEVDARVARLHPNGASFGIQFEKVGKSLAAQIEAYARKAPAEEV